MNTDIRAIFIDLGNTLRMLEKDEPYQAAARKKIADLLGSQEDPAALCEKLNQRYQAYREWAFEHMREAPEAELWTRWLAPEFPAEKVAPLGVELTYQFRQSNGRRVLVENGREVVLELDRRGYTLGIISNLISSREIPEWIERDGFSPYFKSVLLSSVYGIRKPDPAIYHEAARRAGVAPKHCAYIGDNLKRDVTGTRTAGFGMVVIMLSPQELAEATITEENRPDVIIHDFKQLLDIFPDPSQHVRVINLPPSMKITSQPRGAVRLAESVRELYNQGQTDYSLEPIVLADKAGKPIGRIADGDSVVFCCRRGEREIELTEAFTEAGFPHFPRPDLQNLHFVILTLYHDKFKDLPVAFAPSKVRNTLGEVVSRAGLSQLHTSESEKFAHVTFFFNGGNNQPFPLEQDVRVPSPKGIPFDQVPEMSLEKVSAQVLEGIRQRQDLIIVNFANGDVLGHTANREAKIRCAEFLDHSLGQVVKAAGAAEYVLFVTADHGNLEEMTNPDGTPHVSHTTNPVPLILVDPRQGKVLRDKNLFREGGRLADLALTILPALGLAAPPDMTGTNLLPNMEWGEKRKVILLILDGWGIGRQDEGNPIFLASTPTWDGLLRDHPSTSLQAAGEAVGLKEGKAGNSEAGHMNIGAGRLVLQDDVRLDQAMQDGSFYTNEILCNAIARARDGGGNLHLIGLLTEKSSHGSIDYPLALLKMAKANGMEKVFLHVIFDGRSTEPGSAPALLEKLEHQVDEIGTGQVVTGVGRGIALDRDGNYAKIRRAFDALVSGAGKLNLPG